jgi:hypothetical protein
MRYFNGSRMRVLFGSFVGLVACAIAAGCGASGGGGSDRADAAPGSDAFTLPDASGSGALSVLFVDPDHGPFPGGTEVTVRGTGFDTGVEVTFGGRSVDPIFVNVIDERRLEVITPPGDPGLAEVRVELAGDIGALPGAFTYESIYVDPPLGSVAGGTFVTVYGLATEFDATTTVLFDGLPLTAMQVVNDTSLTGITPPGVAGSADVVVNTVVGSFEAQRGYVYESTGDPFFGGMSGGPITGDVNVVVIDATTRNGVPGAYVVLDDLPNA